MKKKAKKKNIFISVGFILILFFILTYLTIYGYGGFNSINEFNVFINRKINFIFHTIFPS